MLSVQVGAVFNGIHWHKIRFKGQNEIRLGVDLLCIFNFSVR